MTLDQLAVLVKVVQAGSFTRAADLLDVRRSHVSRAIASLERELDATLFRRTTRTLSVTDHGREVFERAVQILDAVDDTRQRVRRAQETPSGRLRLACRVEFGIVTVGAWVARFLERHPQVSVDCEYTSRPPNLVQEGFDLAILGGPIADSRMVARRLGSMAYGLYASPAYLRRFGTPDSPEALAGHRLVVYAGGKADQDWRLSRRRRSARVKVDNPARLRVNAGSNVLEALVGGLGVGSLPEIAAAGAVADKRLVRVLADWSQPAEPVFAVYAGRRYVSPNVRAFIELALEQFPGGAPSV
jgi:DNA-binding transcriptional LysR family regulator